jgi:hypothetical protein
MDKLSNQRRRLLKTAVLATALISGTAFACYCYVGKIHVTKYYDKNANGKFDAGEVRLSGWPMTVGKASTGAISTKLTDSYGYALFSGLAVGNTYWVLEGTPVETNWKQSSPVDGYGNPINPQVGIVVKAGYTTNVKFGNYCKKPSGGRTPGFWSNKNGEAKLLDGTPSSLLPELNLLVSLNLVNADGSAFNPTTYPQFRTWLLASTADNMAYKLSSHVAAMQLNVEGGFVSGSAFYAPFGGTVNQLLAAANTSLGLYPNTPTGHPQRANQESLKNALDALNNGANVIPSSPSKCKRTFTPPPY